MRSVALGPSFALLGGAAFFLWMFFAVAPLETLADIGGLSGAEPSEVIGRAYRFAADWRHGMTGNSPLYMPGFFVLAVATWLWSGSDTRRMSRLAAEGGGILMAAVVVAWACSGIGREAIVSAFARSSHLTIVAPWPDRRSRYTGPGRWPFPTRAYRKRLCPASGQLDNRSHINASAEPRRTASISASSLRSPACPATRGSTCPASASRTHDRVSR